MDKAIETQIAKLRNVGAESVQDWLARIRLSMQMQAQQEPAMRIVAEGRSLERYGAAARLEALAIETAAKCGTQAMDESFRNLNRRASVASPASMCAQAGYAEEEKTMPTEPVTFNVNTADAKELCKLKGVGEAKAKAILDARASAAFENSEDLIKRVKGIGEKTVQTWRNVGFILVF